MILYKCKMCDGELEINEGSILTTCKYCGIQQTIPRFASEHVRTLLERADYLRKNSEFDKAISLYEQILVEDHTDAEIYWLLVLCTYGIEYVDDLLTHKRIPTMNRTQRTSIYADENYKMALEHSSSDSQRAIYEQEAKVIDETQKNIFRISEKEKPFDVFICYKETDDYGRRTPDSVLANDIYHQLTQEGIKVFYARITLEEKLGEEYEPYIFAALNSAKVMLVLGTKPEYFKAPWVRNEWSRYLALMKSEAGKYLLPAYKDMSPEEIPEEFSHFQSYDMAKLGFISDLIRGIVKMLGKDEKEEHTEEETDEEVQSIQIAKDFCRKGEEALINENWSEADICFEKALNYYAECTQAYLGKMMVLNHQKSIESLATCIMQRYAAMAKPQKITACKDETIRIQDTVRRYYIENYLPATKISDLYVFDRGYYSYVDALEAIRVQAEEDLPKNRFFKRVLQFAAEGDKYVELMQLGIIGELSKMIAEAKDADEESVKTVTKKYLQFLDEQDMAVQVLYEQAYARREADYQGFVGGMKTAETVGQFDTLAKEFQYLGSYKDSVALAAECERIRAELIKKRQKKILLIIGIIAAVIIGLIGICTLVGLIRDALSTRVSYEDSIIYAHYIPNIINNMG